jgi:hypothetical protein
MAPYNKTCVPNLVCAVSRVSGIIHDVASNLKDWKAK